MGTDREKSKQPLCQIRRDVPKAAIGMVSTGNTSTGGRRQALPPCELLSPHPGESAPLGSGEMLQGACFSAMFAALTKKGIRFPAAMRRGDPPLAAVEAPPDEQPWGLDR